MIEKVEAYVREHYKRMYGDKPLIIQEFDSHFTIKSNKDHYSSQEKMWEIKYGKM